METVKERFAAIELDVENRLATIATDPPLWGWTTHVAGFPIVQYEARSTAISRTVTRLAAYATAKAKLIGDLRTAGVTPLATVPAAVWDHICRASGLHRGITGDGKIPINTQIYDLHYNRVLKKIANKALLVVAACWLLLMFAGIAIAELNHPTNAQSAEAFYIFLGGAFAMSVIGAVVTSVYAVGGFARRLTHWYLLRYKWNNTLSLILERGWRHMDVVLPEPPPSVQDILLKVRYLNPRTAAVAEAIHIPELFAYRPVAPTVDPIVYIERDGVVAIVAQFGDFPIEREIVQWLSAGEILGE